MQTILQRLAQYANMGQGARQLRRRPFQRARRRRLQRRLQRLEQLEERILLSVGDYGDAPTSAQSGFASSYPTTLADNGAWHTATGPTLGANRGVESNGQPTSGADGDDNDGDDDEDGVTFVPGFLTPGDAAATVAVDMTASPGGGQLSAWIDFNADGDWDDAGEQVFTNTALTGGAVNSLTFVVPATAELGPTYARFRVSTLGVFGCRGSAFDGEVEDYRVSIAIPPNTHGLFPGEQFPVGTSPSSVAAADLNGDTYVDLITANRLTHDVSVLLSLGDGTFATQVTYAVGHQPRDVAVADLNGDGRPDIVTANGLDDDVSVLLGRGNGTFAAQVTYDVGQMPHSVALSDLNGDNKVDIVAANFRDHNVSVLLGRGNGTFNAQVTYAVGTQPYGARPESVELADLNGDHYVDIVTANDLSDDVSVLLGRGNGTFAPYTTYAVGQDPQSVALADLNGDNHVDIVTSSNLDNNVSVLLGRGDGTFAARVTYHVGISPHCVALSDLNHDGRVDILAGYYGKQVAVLLGLGDGTFATQVSYFVGNQPLCVLPIDVNGDSHVDIVTANDPDNSVSVLFGDGNGTFPLQVTDAVGDYPSSLALADLNDDSRVDIVAVNRNAHNVSVLLGLGNGSFVAQVTYPVGTNPNAVALADLNGDNHVDIVTANAVSDNVSVLLGIGDGTFATQVTYAATDAPLSVALADLNGDSHVDIVAANTNNNNVSVLLGRGDGTFNEQVSYPVGYAPYWVALSDLNGDSHVDIVTANENEDDVSVLLGLGDGTFATQVTYAVGDQPYCVALVDLNGDSHADIVTANFWDNNVSVLLGIGDGTFAPQATHAVGSSPRSVVPDDINGDGQMDLVVANYNSDNVSVLLGIGDGTFAPQATYAAGTDPCAVAVADLNPNTVAVADLNSYAIAAANLNAGIHKDLVTVNANDDNVSVLLNQRGPKQFDYGDAPDPAYPTLLASDGARHTAAGPTLGSNRDTETDGQPTTDADSDDATGTPDDEDGVTLPVLTASTFHTTTASVTVDLQNAGSSSNRLDAWIDFNQDGDWDDSGEQIFTNYNLGTTGGTQSLAFTIPQDTGDNVVYGTTYARFRLSTAGGLLPTGFAGDGEVEDYQLTIHSHVVSRHILYNRSVWDGNNGAANANDDAAIATDKAALLPGQAATFVNYTSYDKGLNGVMIDVGNLQGTPTVADFLFRTGVSRDPYGINLNDPADDWPWAPAPTSITVRAGAGQDGADRVTLIWADGVIKKCWLQVTMLATDATGLAAHDVFYVGNAVGESGNSTSDALVNATDEIGARNNPHSPFTPALVNDHYDYNRDKLVNATDQIIARNNRTSPFTALLLIKPPLEPGDSVALLLNPSMLQQKTPQPNSASDQCPESRLSREAGGDHWAPHDDFAQRDLVADSVVLSTSAHTTVTVAAPDARGLGLSWLPATGGSARREQSTAASLARETMRPQQPSNARQLDVVQSPVLDATSRLQVGHLDEVNQRDDLAGRIRWAAEGQADDELRARDQALTELLTEWKQ